MSENLPTPTPAPTGALPARRATFNVWNALQVVLSVGIIVATLLTLWTPANLFSDDLLNQMLSSIQNEQITPAPLLQITLTPASKPRIGIVSGHWGNNSGAVCQSDGLQEVDVNLRIATLVRKKLQNAGYEVDLLQEFDKRLSQYDAAALISIHNDSCEYINDEATGFKVAPALSNAYPEQTSRLANCLIENYKKVTNLPFRSNSITGDMTNYHAFNEVRATTPAAIIETGFLNLDRRILTEKPDLIAKGISDGILCYIRNESVPSNEGTPQQ